MENEILPGLIKKRKKSGLLVKNFFLDIGTPKNFSNAKKKVYEVVKKIKWKNSFFRKDIGFRAKKLK